MKRIGIFAAIVTVLAAAAFAQYNTAIYTKQGGADMVVGSGGQVTYEDGGTLRLDGGSALEVETGAVTLSSNAGTLSQLSGKITTEALSTAAGDPVTLTITNTLVAATDIILVTRNGGTSDEGTPEWTVTPGSGSFTILLENRHASAAFDGTFIFGFLVVKQAT